MTARPLSRYTTIVSWTTARNQSFVLAANPSKAATTSSGAAVDCSFNAKHADIARVLNNPFFYKDRNATERRLVAIAEDSGLRFALDRISVILSAAVLAREIALLNYGGRNPQKVESAQSNLVISIAETMTDWGLNPTVGLEEVEQ